MPNINSRRLKRGFRQPAVINGAAAPLLGSGVFPASFIPVTFPSELFFFRHAVVRADVHVCSSAARVSACVSMQVCGRKLLFFFPQRSPLAVVKAVQTANLYTGSSRGSRAAGARIQHTNRRTRSDMPLPASVDARRLRCVCMNSDRKRSHKCALT